MWEQIQQLFSNLWFQLFTIVFIATVHGFGAAWLAVRMLFRPYKPVKILGLTIFPQGMIPRHRDRLAIAIGNAVGNELVSQETVTDALFKTGFLQNKIESLIDVYAENLLARDFPSFLEAMPESWRVIVLDSISNLQTRLSDYISQTLKGEETAEAVREFVERQADKLLSRRVAETLDNETFVQVVQFVENRVRGIVHEPAFERRVREFINDRVNDLANTKTPLGEMFTADFVEFFRERVTSQIQPIVGQLAEISTSEKTREQISALIKTEVGDYYGQLPFYQKFFVSRDKLYREVDDLVNTTLPRKIEETLRGAAFAQEAERFLNASIEQWLSLPLPELLGKIAVEKLENLKEQISGSLLGLVQGAEMQNSISAYLTDTLEQLRPHSWRAIIEHVHPETASRLKKALTSGLLYVLQREETGETLNNILNGQIDRLLITPIGQLTRYISPETVRNLSNSLADRIVSAAREKLPSVITEFDIARLVREKVDAYPLEKLEALVLSIAGQHLRTIELFGLVIGLIIGIFQAFYFWAVPRH